MKNLVNHSYCAICSNICDVQDTVLGAKEPPHLKILALGEHAICGVQMDANTCSRRRRGHRSEAMVIKGIKCHLSGCPLAQWRVGGGKNLGES